MSETTLYLNPEQIAEVKAEMVPMGTPVRFLFSGRNLNISTGELLPRGVNVIYHHVYWNFTKATAHKILGWLNDRSWGEVKAVFSE